MESLLALYNIFTVLKVRKEFFAKFRSLQGCVDEGLLFWVELDIRKLERTVGKGDDVFNIATLGKTTHHDHVC